MHFSCFEPTILEFMRLTCFLPIWHAHTNRSTDPSKANKTATPEEEARPNRGGEEQEEHAGRTAGLAVAHPHNHQRHHQQQPEPAHATTVASTAAEAEAAHSPSRPTMPLPQSPSSPGGGETQPIAGGAAGAGAGAGGRQRTRSWLNRLNGGAPMDEEAARRYRQRVFQMGLLVCLFLLFVDQRGAATTVNGGFGDTTGNSNSSSSQASASAHGGELDDDWVVQGVPDAQVSRLNQFLQLQPWDGGFYPQNVTGVYRGAWSRNSSVEPERAVEKEGEKGPSVTLREEGGRFDMPLFMASIPGVEGLSAVYGYLRLFDGEGSTDRDVYTVAKGVYLHKSGRILLRSVDQASSEKVAFTFALPASYKGNATAAEEPAPATAAPAGPGDKVQQAPAAAPAADDDDGQRRLLQQLQEHQRVLEQLPPSWRRRRAATPQEQALGARLAALWHDDRKGKRDEETRLLQVFEAVVQGPGGEGEDEPSEALGMTLLGDDAAAAGGEEHLAKTDGRVVASVVIPNRAKGQYIRQPSANGRGCVFTLDAHTLPRLNSTQLAEARETAGVEEGKAAAAVVAAGGAGAAADDDDEDVGLDDEEGDGDGVETLAANKAVDERLVWAEGLQGVLHSPECRLTLALESHEAVRLDWGKAYRKAVNYSIVVTLVCVLQIALLFRQLYFSRTQAAASRVSLLCIGQQAILDALLCIAHLLLCATLQPLFAAFASIAFFKLVIFSIFEIRYMFIIHQSRNSQSANAANFNGLRRQLASLHARFYAILFMLLFLIYFLANYLEVIIFLLYSFWVPQIVLNATKGIRHPLNRTYVVGMSAARLVIPLYLYGCPENFIHLLFSDYKPAYRMCAALVTWQALQVAVLLSQDFWGPQYMIPARFLPPKYDYYRPIPQQVLRRGGTEAPGAEGGQGRGDEIEMTDIEGGEMPECVICYNGIDVAQPGGYMLAPCLHLFHKECLERWMDIKLECPTCRAGLPMR